jgi:lipid II:glycine glycyltransferase (peptidoglycan interpeptide bridge formation enzyme)
MQKLVVPPDGRDDWNAFVAASPYGHTLQSWEWGELKERTGWQAIRLALAEDGEYRAAAQVLIRDLPLGAGRVAYVPKGPVLEYGDTALLGHMLAVLRDLARAEGVLSLKVEPEVTEPYHHLSELLDRGLRPASPVQMRSTIWVDLTAGEDEMLARQKQKTRYNIRLAAKKGVTVASGGPDDLIEWYRVFALTAARDGFSIHSLDYYRQVLAILGERDMARLLLARHEGDLLAGIIVFCFGHTAQYMYGASSNEKRNLMAPYLVQWEGMRWARGRGACVYDLWGIPDRLDESEDLWGVYRHKRGYGGEIVRYIGAYDLVQAPIRHWAMEDVARPLLKRFARWRGAQPQ